jgi:hypothetical protein
MRPDRRSHLFTVRIWTEALGDGRVEWRGQAQHALSGERRYFRVWPALVSFLLALIPADTPDHQVFVDRKVE